MLCLTGKGLTLRRLSNGSNKMFENLCPITHTYKAWNDQAVSFFLWTERCATLGKIINFNQPSNKKQDEYMTRLIQVKTYNFQINFNWHLRNTLSLELITSWEILEFVFSSRKDNINKNVMLIKRKGKQQGGNMK